MSDTVGFIRKLPHSLIESFKSTLDEVREADILLHVVDVSHPSFEDHIEVVKNTLTEIGATDKQTIIVYNKIDKLDEERRIELFPNGMANLKDKNEIYISAIEKENIDDFRKRIYDAVLVLHKKIYPNYLEPEYF